jgi:hypothetical protein
VLRFGGRRCGGVRVPGRGTADGRDENSKPRWERAKWISGVGRFRRRAAAPGRGEEGSRMGQLWMGSMFFFWGNCVPVLDESATVILPLKIRLCDFGPLF